MTVAALYVDARGPYPSLPRVDAWHLPRDARTYSGPHPVVAHPPCATWGRWRWRATGGDEEHSCGPRAVAQVRAHGGVLEHPAASNLWTECGLPVPGALPDAWGGWTLEVDQCDWGHPARKRTWLYLVRVGVLPPTPAPGEPVAVVCPTAGYRGRRGDPGWRPHVPKSRRHLTPPAFAAWLVALAEGVRP